MEDVPARTLSLNPAADWMAEVGMFLERMWCAVQAFGGAMRKEPIRARGERRRTRTERTVVPRPAPPKKSGELPETYGQTKVVAMVVSPYLVHVYWDLAPADRAASGPASLRFRDIATGGSFDVTVDLAARNWYVHLWTPDKRYSVELGRQQGGAFTPLARSNPIETPRAWPVAAVEQLERAMTAGRTVAAEPAPVAPAVPTPEPVSRTWMQAAPSAQPKQPSVPATPAPVVPASATYTLKERLAELYRLRGWPRSPAAAASLDAEATVPELPEILGPEVSADFTARLESQFSPGLSSALLGRQDSSKPIR